MSSNNWNGDWGDWDDGNWGDNDWGATSSTAQQRSRRPNSRWVKATPVTEANRAPVHGLVSGEPTFVPTVLSQRLLDETAPDPTPKPAASPTVYLQRKLRLMEFNEIAEPKDLGNSKLDWVQLTRRCRKRSRALGRGKHCIC